jgi:Uncharacterized conserved protein
MISTVTGQFKNFTVSAEAGDDFSDPTGIEVIIEASSIDTRNEQRDGHLRSADFFDAENYPQVVFKGTRFHNDTLYGELTIKDVTKEIALQVERGGVVVDPYGQTKAGFTVQGRISRKEFGLTWSAVTEAGQVVVSDEIKFHADIQLVKQS